MSGGYPVSGTLTVLQAPRPGEEVREVPGVPVMPGGKGGAVFSSDDGRGRGWSSIYLNPGSVEENLAYYRGALPAGGWRETDRRTGEANLTDFASLSFVRRGEELVLLLSQSGSGAPASTAGKTVVMVALGSRVFSE
jgi:hypothetical protein